MSSREGNPASFGDAPNAVAPENGVRFTFELERGSSGNTFRYRGAARLAGRDVPLLLSVRIDGEDVTVDGGALPEEGEVGASLTKNAVALVRTAVRSAVVRGQSAPRRVQRWREP